MMQNKKKGRFIVLEGGEGAGKSTQIPLIKEKLISLGIPGDQIISVREPGGTPAAELMRDLLKKEIPGDVLCPVSELLLMYAARAQLLERKIKPALEKGFYVIGDRHDLSTVAYQGAGRGISDDIIDSLRQIVLGNFRPDLTLVFDVPVKTGLMRAKGRGQSDRFEKEQISFFERIRASFLAAAVEDPAKIKVIDASQDIEAVTHDVFVRIEELVCTAG